MTAHGLVSVATAALAKMPRRDGNDICEVSVLREGNDGDDEDDEDDDADAEVGATGARGRKTSEREPIQITMHVH
jgi:hypothetical protein